MYLLSMRKKAQIDKQMFFDFYGVSLLSDQYLEVNSYAKEYKDMIVQQIKDVYVPLIPKVVYAKLKGHLWRLNDWYIWKENFNITSKKEVENLTLEQIVQMYREGDWKEDIGSVWADITESFMQLKNTTDTNQLIMIIDHINDLEHNNGFVLELVPQFSKWITDALDIKAQSTSEGLIPYLSTDLQKLVTEDLKLRGQEVVAPERYVYLTKKEKQELAVNLSTSPEILAELSKDKSEKVRMSVAENPSTPPEVLTELAKDKSMNVREGVAENLNTPPETLAELAKDKFWSIREGVADNPNTPPEIKEQLKQVVSLSMRKKAQIVYDDKGRKFEVI